MLFTITVIPDGLKPIRDRVQDEALELSSPQGGGGLPALTRQAIPGFAHAAPG
jgi:hypothetical protein